jgi:predicted nucleotidyltransferase
MTDSAASLHGVPVSRDRIVEFCRRWKVSELCLFGSALRDDFRPDSDVDILISFGPGISCGFDDLLTMKEELETIFGRRVDLVERRLVETSENYIRRKHILSHLELLYSEPVRTAADAGGAGPD